MSADIERSLRICMPGIFMDLAGQGIWVTAINRVKDRKGGRHVVFKKDAWYHHPEEHKDEVQAILGRNKAE